MMKIKTLTILLCAAAWPASSVVADTVDIREWLVPWPDSEPGHTRVDTSGRVWFAGEAGDFIANFSPESGEFNRYDLRRGTRPVALAVDSDRTLWFASSRRRHIGSLNPSTGRVSEFEMPDRKARDPRSIAFDQAGNLWFTVEDGNSIGVLRVLSGDMMLIRAPTKKVRPHGITFDAKGTVWAAGSGQNILLRVDPANMTITEIRTPNEESRFRRIITTSDNLVWYADYELGNLGRYNPQNGEFAEWPLPGGPDSMPHGMAVDRNDRIWIVETGRDPNRLIGFDAASQTFVSETGIPSGAGSIGDMFYDESSGEIWFGTRSNYIGRAKVH